MATHCEVLLCYCIIPSALLSRCAYLRATCRTRLDHMTKILYHPNYELDYILARPHSCRFAKMFPLLFLLAIALLVMRKFLLPLPLKHPLTSLQSLSIIVLRLSPIVSNLSFPSSATIRLYPRLQTKPRLASALPILTLKRTSPKVIQDLGWMSGALPRFSRS